MLAIPTWMVFLGGFAWLRLLERPSAAAPDRPAYSLAEAWDFYDLYRQGDLDGASDRLLKRFGRSTTAREVARDLTLLGRIRKEQGRAEEAEEIWRAAEEADPGHGGVPMERAFALADESRFAEALPLAEVALGREPEWPTGAAIMAWMQAGVGAAEESRRWAARAGTENLRDVEAGPHLYCLAMAAHLRGERDEARAWLEQVVERDAESAYGRRARQLLDSASG